HHGVGLDHHGRRTPEPGRVDPEPGLLPDGGPAQRRHRAQVQEGGGAELGRGDPPGTGEPRGCRPGLARGTGPARPAGPPWRRRGPSPARGTRGYLRTPSVGAALAPIAFRVPSARLLTGAAPSSMDHRPLRRTGWT